MPVISKNEKELLRKVLYGIVAVFAVLLLVGTFCDFQLTSALYVQDQALAQLISAVGLQPLAPPLCILLGALVQRHLAGSRSIIFKVLICIALVLAGCYSFAEMMKSFLSYDGIGPLLPFEVSKDVSRGLGAILGLVLMVVGYRSALKNDDEKLMQRLVVTVLLLVGVFIFSEIIKGFMHRPRHRTIVLGYEGIEFQPWYLPFHGHKELTEMYQLSSDAFKSFPSGHCIQTGAAVISFYGLAALYPALRSKWGVATVVFIALVLCVPISRLVLGAHYLSDVAVGIVLSALAGIYLLGREDLS